MVTWHWSADTLFWQVPSDHSMIGQHQRYTLCCKPRLQDLLTRVRPPCCATSSLGARARDPFLPWEKCCMGFYFYACMWSGSYSYGAPLGGPSGAPLWRHKRRGALGMRMKLTLDANLHSASARFSRARARARAIPRLLTTNTKTRH